MMFGYLSMEFLDSLKEGDSWFLFHARRYSPGTSEGFDIDGADYFEPGHNPHPRTFAEAAKELYRLRDRYLEDFPGLSMKLDRKEGMGALILPMSRGGFIILGFETVYMDRERFDKLKAQLEADKKASDNKEEQ